jgi:ADP-heptose:LPS heptosyltransferase
MRAIVARLDNDGDVLLAGPAIRAVAAGAESVTLLCGPRGAQAAALLPGVDRVLVRRAEWIDPEAPPVDRAAIDAYISAIAAERADVAVVLTSFHQSALPLALLLRMAGVPHIAAISEDFPGSLLDERVADPGDVPEPERALTVAAAAGFALPAGDDGRLRVAATEPAPVALPDRYVVVHPGASVSARAWPAEHHAALVAALAAGGRHVVVTGAPSERALTAAVAAAGPAERVLDLGGATSLPELAGVLAGAEAVVVGNTGPAHLAAAVGTPIVSLFAPTVPAARWRPYGVAHELLHVPVPCAGCRARTCPVAGHPCLAGVTPGDVLAALDRLAGSATTMTTAVAA